MIFNFFLNFIILTFGAIFTVLPSATKLPTIGGYDIDGALVTGMGAFHTFVAAFWPIQDMFYGALAIFAYFGIKMLARLLLGHRAPGVH